MMNLAKMKRLGMKKRYKYRNGLKKALLTAATILCITTPLYPATYLYAAEQAGDAITIEKPEGWKQGETKVTVSVDASQMGEGFQIAKIEAKVGKDGSWQDITESKSVTIKGNDTVYVRVTDQNGTVYEQNRSIRCYDTEKPTLSASLTDGILTIQGNDSVSGISAITVNGTTYTELQDGKLKIQLTQKDFTTKQIEITVTDGAGNSSDKYTLQNPYYEWAVKQSQEADTETMSSTNTTGTESTENSETSPLPQDAQASEPTEARGTVEERTVTGIEEELAQSGESTESVTQTASDGTKEFYTISTKSGKIFYLVVDNSRSQDNVYFLTEVSEKDLMNFTLSDTVTLPEVDTVYAEPETEEPTSEPESETAEEEPEEPEVEMPEDKSPIGSYLLIGVIAAAVLGAGYYFKIYKPKHEYDNEDEYEEEETEENEKDEEPDDEEENSSAEEYSEDVLEDEEE